MTTDISVPGTFRLDDLVMYHVHVAEDRLVSIRINEHGEGLLGFMKKYDPAIDSRGAELVPCATARFNEDDLVHVWTEISLSPEALQALRVLLNRHVK